MIRQNIPLRGHRDDGAIDLESENQNEGNFRELLKYRVDAGDQILHSHLKNAPKNSSLTSKTTQNDLINCCGTIIEKKIVEEVNQSKYFSILVDETTDISSNEQLSLCVRFVDREKCYLYEEFLRFVVVQDLSGEALSKVVLSELWDLGLDIPNLRGQGYDGGANMSGKFRGVQARILKEQPLAYYMHCASHCLNLSLSKSCSVPSVRQTVDTVAEIAKYVRESSKRSIMMKEKISQICPEHKKTKLKTLCETRWIERHDAVLQFLDIFSAVISFLEDFGSYGTKAHLMLNSILKFEFIISLHILAEIFGITLCVSRKLQSPNLELSQCYHMVECVMNKAVTLAQSVDVEVNVPRVASRQIHRNNVASKSPKDYYRLNVFLPFLDHLLSDLSVRFSPARNNFYPNIRELLTILCVMPVTTCTAERSFSTLRRVKTYLRSTMNQDKLNGLVLLNIHRNIDVSPDEVIELFARKHPRRLQLC
ncbi:52 kDa repressor of the inhibitor of the protein kinase-like [Periplaneta americana]|uniref:52 kDa repressor of the inhibitor of the protein kinase-like n=1 Tax=Periplaneta americana TaxID=6978 RepID=UPI0037E82671